MGTAYRQDVVAEEGAYDNGSLQVLYDIRRLLSIQYGDETPLTGWALQPAPTGIWLSYIERAFDSNYAPAYIAVSFFIPEGYRLKTEALPFIKQSILKNHGRFMQQSVVLHKPDWSFLPLMGRALEGMLEKVNGGYYSYRASDKNAYWQGEMPQMLQNLWDERFGQYRIVFCGKAFLSTKKEFAEIEGGEIVSGDSFEQQASVENTMVQEAEEVIDEEPYEEENENVSAEMTEAADEDDEVTKVDEDLYYTFQEEPAKEEDKPRVNDTHSEVNKKEEATSGGGLGGLFSFKGRIRRTVYGFTCVLFSYYINTPLLLGDSVPDYVAFIWLALLIPVLGVFYAQGAKRCHDLGHNGWWQLIPLYGFWMLFKDGEKGENKYGMNPKANEVQGRKGNKGGTGRTWSNQMMSIVGILAMLILIILVVKRGFDYPKVQEDPDPIEEVIIDSEEENIIVDKPTPVSHKIILSSRQKLFLSLTWDNVKDGGVGFYEKYEIEDEVMKTRTGKIIEIANRIGRNRYEKAYRNANKSDDTGNNCFDILEEQLHKMENRNILPE